MQERRGDPVESGEARRVRSRAWTAPRRWRVFVLGAVLALIGATAPAASEAPGRGTKASRWHGDAHLAKVSGHLLRARELSRLGLGLAEIRKRVPAVRLADNLVEVDVRLAAVGGDVEQRLAAAGMEVGRVFATYRRATGRCPLDRLDEVAALPEVTAVRPVFRPRTRAGSVVSQGDVSINADDARLAFGVDGTGIDVGVLSDSFHTTIGGVTTAWVCETAGGDLPIELLSGSQPQLSGDLPAEVTVLDNCDAADFCSFGWTDEGAALAEIVHDLAPGAGILFHTAFRSEADFAEGISELAACGADVIVDDVIWPAEPMFQDGLIAQAAQAAVDGGVAYFSAAGNDAGFGADEVYLDANAGSDDDEAFPTTGVDLHDFGGGDRFAAITIPPGCGVDLVLQWNQPFSGVLGPGAANDLDLYLCRTDSGAQDPGDGRLAGCDPDNEVAGALSWSADVQGCGTTSGDPLEITSYLNDTGSTVTGYVAVEHYCGAKSDVRFRIAVSAFGGCSLVTSGYGFEPGIFDRPQLYGHAAAAGAHAVAAVFYGEIDSGGAVEPPLGQIDVTPSSSLGGDLPFYFDDVGDPLPGAPVARFKPDLAAPEGTNTSFFGVDTGYDPDSFPNIFGTSAAVPHAAAVAALMLDRYPGLAPAAMRAILQSSATDIEAAGVDPLSGSGLVDAYEAVLATPFAAIGVSPNELDFGLVELGESSTLTLVLSNSGTADLHVTDIGVSDTGVFALDPNPAADPCGSVTPTIPPSESCAIGVVFSPSQAEHSATLTILSDSYQDGVKVVALSGEGFVDCSTLPDALMLTDGRQDDATVEYEACTSITAGPYSVGPAGDVTFRAGSLIIMRDGFQVLGTFRAVLDPLFQPAP